MNLLSGQLIVLKRGIKRKENRSDNETNIKMGRLEAQRNGIKFFSYPRRKLSLPGETKIASY